MSREECRTAERTLNRASDTVAGCLRVWGVSRNGAVAYADSLNGNCTRQQAAKAERRYRKAIGAVYSGQINGANATRRNAFDRWRQLARLNAIIVRRAIHGELSVNKAAHLLKQSPGTAVGLSTRRRWLTLMREGGIKKEKD